MNTKPVFEQCDPERRLFAHQYSVAIENCSSESVKLLNRHWQIFGGQHQIADVKGEGVVGQQPILLPRQEFTYSSWTVINEPIGFMLGSYTFRSESGVFFNVSIPRFELIFADESLPH